MAEKSKKYCFSILMKLSEKRKTYPGLQEALTILQEEANTRGLEDDDIALLTEIITEKNLDNVKRISLMKCLIPKSIAPDKEVKKIIVWCLSSLTVISNALAAIIFQWLIGLWDNRLIKRETFNMFYDVFFYALFKNEKLENYIAHLIYVLTKPEDVTRRQVSRLLTYRQQSSKAQKPIVALLSLFKSYKPELVPERIPALNVESVWRSIPEVFRLGFEDARNRCENIETLSMEQEFLKWNITYKRSRKKIEPLIPPFAYYLNIKSTMYKRQETKVISDCTDLKELRKYQLNIELPCNSMSLLGNMGGYHLLAFTEYDYQNRFFCNLYNTLRKAFIFESENFSYEERDKLLDVILECLHYMQQGIPVINRFLDEYLSYNIGEYRMKLLALFEWSIFMPVMDLQHSMAKHLQTIFYESSLDVKCSIIKSLRLFITNLFVNQDFKEWDHSRIALFCNQRSTSDFRDTVRVATKIARDLIVSGLNVHCYNVLIMSEALTFYEEVYRLESHSDVPLWTIAPPAVVYGAFLSKSCAILSRVCNLLLSYREMNNRLQELRIRHLFEKEIHILNVYAKDLAKALWFDEVFSGKDTGYFLNTFPSNILEQLAESRLDLLFNVSNHYAILPYRWALDNAGLEIDTKENSMIMASIYYPAISNFCMAFHN